MQAATATGSFTCSECGGSHSWHKKDSFSDFNYAVFGDMDTGRIVCLDCAATIEAREREQARVARARRLERNQAARMRNAAIREICGTSARAARADMGM